MKSLSIVTLLALFVGCGREARVLPAMTDIKGNGNVMPASAAIGVMDSEARSGSLLVFPEAEDLEKEEKSGTDRFGYIPGGATAVYWDAIFDYETFSLENELVYSVKRYAHRLKRSYHADEDSFYKAKHIAKIILTAGEARDISFRQKERFEKAAAVERKALEDFETDLSPVLAANTCYHQGRRPSRRGSVDCRSAQDVDAGYERNKDPEGCGDLLRFNYLDGTTQEVLDARVRCEELINRLDAVEAETDVRIPVEQQVRRSGEELVLEFLPRIEDFNNRFFVAKVGSKEKPATSRSKTVLKLNADMTEIVEFKLYLEGVTISAPLGPEKVYSIENGGIQNARIFTDFDGVKKLGFKLTTRAFTMFVNADLSYEPGAMGQRFTDSEVEVFYPDGKQRVGVFKLEFDVE